MGAAAKIGLILAMVALVAGAQLIEHEIATSKARPGAKEARAERRGAPSAAPGGPPAPGLPPLAALLAPLDDVGLPEVPPVGPGGGAAIASPEGIAAAEAAASPGAAAERTYIVQPGDTLAKIARKTLGREAAWQAIYERNRGTIRDPARLQVGTALRIPSPGAPPAAVRRLTTGAGLR
jgi:nucleoid-associated protein YgaU